MRRLPLLLVALVLAGCGGRPPAAAPQTPAPAPAPSTPAAPAPDPPVSSRPLPTPARQNSREEVRESLLDMAGREGEQGVKRYAESKYGGSRFPPNEIPWAEADLDGDGTKEIVLALPVADKGDAQYSLGTGAALFVVYRKDGAWAVDRSDPMEKLQELELMAPHLHAVADLAGLGRPQIIWYRPEMIATGPQPKHVFVTTWKPGAFAQLPGEMVISNGKVALDGKDLLLTGLSRFNWMIRQFPLRIDRYRFVDGAFRRVDRRFEKEGEFGHDRLWDGLVAEESGRTRDAEQHYRAVLDPAMKVHRGERARYNQAPYQLTDAEMTQFGAALHEFARFRLGALLLQGGRKDEALAVLQGGTGLTETMRTAATREQGCKAATTWATANPAFLEALSLGSSSDKWAPEALCSYPSLEDSFASRRY